MGLFNPSAAPARVSVDWAALGLGGQQQVRDLWRQKDLGVHATGFAADIRPHGVVMVRVTPTR